MKKLSEGETNILNDKSNEEIKNLFRICYHYGFNGGLYERILYETKQHTCNSFDEWFNEKIINKNRTL